MGADRGPDLARQRADHRGHPHRPGSGGLDLLPGGSRLGARVPARVRDHPRHDPRPDASGGGHSHGDEIHPLVHREARPAPARGEARLRNVSPGAGNLAGLDARVGSHRHQADALRVSGRRNRRRGPDVGRLGAGGDRAGRDRRRHRVVNQEIRLEEVQAGDGVCLSPQSGGVPATPGRGDLLSPRPDLPWSGWSRRSDASPRGC